MTMKRARPLLVGIAALVASTAVSACVVHDPYYPSYGYSGRVGVYHVAPARAVRRTHYYRSPYSHHWRRDRDHGGWHRSEQRRYRDHDRYDRDWDD
ncbi:MAG TPA: hypothetical protein VEC57_10455 [Candidatus Limnocylindrales bacterium]|nr:hypothetical protein [Candidatus Limnocylindrales bacterium]